MASNLLNTFKKIDDHRKALIRKANAQGATLPDTASFIDLVPHIGADAPPRFPEYEYGLNTEDWTQPEGWPDCKNILETAEDKDGLKPGVIMLLDATHSDEILLPKYVTGSSSPYLYNGLDAGNICASGYLMSDGTWYGDTTNEITHTWDTTKDIVVETGRFPGRYRWMILYFSPSKSLGYTNFIRFPAVEVIIGNIACSGIGSYPGLFITYNYFGEDTMCKYLLHIEFLANTNISSLSWSWGMNRYFMGGMSKLKHITLGKLISIGSMPSSALFRGCSHLRHLDVATGFKYSNQWTLYDCRSLVTFKAANNYMLLSGDHIQLEEVDNGGASFRINGFAPESTKLKNCILYGTILPTSWKTQGGFKIDYSNSSNGNSSGNFFSNNLDITKLDFSKVDKFYSSSSVLEQPNPTNAPSNSSATVARVGHFCYNLREITWPSVVQDRISIGQTVLYKYCVLELLNNLVDISNIAVTYNYVYLHPYNYDELTEEELAIATNKGWEVIRGWPY